MIRPSCAQILQTIEKARSSDSSHPKAKSYHSNMSEMSPDHIKSPKEYDSHSMASEVPSEREISLQEQDNLKTPRLNSIRKVFSNKIAFFEPNKDNKSQSHGQLEPSRQIQSLITVQPQQTSAHTIFVPSTQPGTLWIEKELVEETPLMKEGREEDLGNQNEEIRGQLNKFLESDNESEGTENGNSIFCSSATNTQNAQPGPIGSYSKVLIQTEKLSGIEKANFLVQQQVLVMQAQDQVSAKLADIEEYVETKELLSELGHNSSPAIPLALKIEHAGADLQKIPLGLLGAAD